MKIIPTRIRKGKNTICHCVVNFDFNKFKLLSQTKAAIH